MNLQDIDSNFIRKVLDNYKNFEWTFHAVGFIRTYLDKEKAFRLHLWNPDFQVPDISYIHTHNWDFTSKILAGELTNIQYAVALDSHGLYERTAIDVEDSQAISKPERCNLHEVSRGTYMMDDTYSEQAETIHTIRLWGKCISIIERKFVQPKAVYSFRPVAEGWANIKPRLTTESEMKYYINLFKELINEPY